MIDALIVDDEPLARKRLSNLLVPYKNRIRVVAEAANGEEALALVERFKPDVIFLDIEMPLMDGFEMLRKLTHDAAIVFITAYDQFAIKAFEENAIDYLLKPVEEQRLLKSIQRLEDKRSPSLQMIQAFLNAVPQQQKKEMSSISVKIGDRIILLKLSELVFIEAEDKYVFFYDKFGNKHLTDYTLNRLDSLLPQNFLRIHRSCMINKDYIKEIRRGFSNSYTFIMNTNSEHRLKSSRGYSENIRKELSF